MDFTLVLGIDSSAAQAIVKLRDSLLNQFDIRLSIFVPGNSDGFPCENNLSLLLDSRFHDASNNEDTSCTTDGSHSCKTGNSAKLTGSRVCDDLDQALGYAEVSRTDHYHSFPYYLAHTLITGVGSAHCYGESRFAQ